MFKFSQKESMRVVYMLLPHSDQPHVKAALSYEFLNVPTLP